jgi:putative transcriptional regulator
MLRFGEKLRTLRTAHGMTLQELANELGYTNHTYINLVEIGKKKPSLELAIRVARLFRVTTDQLVMDELELSEPTASDDDAS